MGKIVQELEKFEESPIAGRNRPSFHRETTAKFKSESACDNLEGHPHVGAQVELAVVLEVWGEGDVAQQLGKGLLDGGDSQVAAASARVPLQQVAAVVGEGVLPDHVLLAQPVTLLVRLAPDVDLGEKKYISQTL